MLIGNMRDFVFDKPAAGHYCPNIGAMEEWNWTISTVMDADVS